MPTFAPLADLIYEAAVIPEVWPRVLTELAAISGSLGSVLIARSEAHVSYVASDEPFGAMAADYFRAYSSHNERMARLLRMRRAGFVSDYDVFSPEEMASEPMFRDFLIPNGFGRGIATVFPIPTGEQIILHCEGRYSPEPFAPVVHDRLNDLRPHVARAAMIGARIAFEAARSATDLLDKLGLPAIAVTGLGKVLVSNRLFEAQAKDLVLGVRNGVVLKDSRAATLLYQSLNASRDNNAVRSIPLQVEGGPAILHMIPVRRSAQDVFNHCAALLVFMRSRSSPSIDTQLLNALFDLTEAEAMIAQSVANGLSIDQIAAARATSRETVRNQVKRILAKTGCHRQGDLGALLRQLSGVAAP